MRKVLPLLILISLEGQKGEEVDILLPVLVSRILLYLARRPPRFQRLIRLFEIPGPS